MSRVTQTTMPQPTENRRILCAYHPNEFLTNFCCDSNCLMPLCPNCIVEHTEQHFLENNRPLYVNINDALTDTKQKCYQHIVVYEQLSRCNDRIFDYVVGLRESIHNQLMEDKLQIVKEIDLLFEVFEEKLFAETTNKYREMEVYDKRETANITEFINEQIESLQDQINVLKGDNCLAGLITYYASDAKVYEESIRDINDYIQKHRQAGKISINNEPDKLGKTLENLCENNLVVEYINQEMLREKEEEMKESRSREVKSLAGRLGLKQSVLQQENAKENSINRSNSDYRNLPKRKEQERVDASSTRTNNKLGYSKPVFPPTLSRPPVARSYY